MKKIKRKVLYIEEPKIKTLWSCWVVHFDYGNGTDIKTYMHEEDVKILMKEEELIKKGYKEIDLINYKDLVKDMMRSEEIRDTQ